VLRVVVLLLLLLFLLLPMGEDPWEGEQGSVGKESVEEGFARKGVLREEGAEACRGMDISCTDWYPFSSADCTDCTDWYPFSRD